MGKKRAAESSAAADESAPAAGERGGWMGSLVSERDIRWLKETGRIPEAVECRLPEGELAPAPAEGERVVFLSHFTRGFGLPASNFFRRFLVTFGLQPQHLGANAILALAIFATFAEAFLGVWPSTELWEALFSLRSQAFGGSMIPCGAACVTVRKNGGFPPFPTTSPPSIGGPSGSTSGARRPRMARRLQIW